MKTATYKKKKVYVHLVSNEYAIVSKTKDKIKMFCVWLTELTFLLLFLLSCKEESKPLDLEKRQSSIGEPEEKYPWSCSEGEIEYYESLIELKDESNSN